MHLNIKKEIAYVINFLNDDTITKGTFSQIGFGRHNQYDRRVNFLMNILNITRKHPRIEPYLINLLTKFTVAELKNVDVHGSILNIMAHSATSISLNAYEIIFNYGININGKNPRGETFLHSLFSSYYCSKYTNEILKLFIRFGADLNVLDSHGGTVLDMFLYSRLDEKNKLCIMTLIDNGVKTYGPKTNCVHLNSETSEFIKYYFCQNIKQAIK